MYKITIPPKTLLAVKSLLQDWDNILTGIVYIDGMPVDCRFVRGIGLYVTFEFKWKYSGVACIFEIGVHVFEQDYDPRSATGIYLDGKVYMFTVTALGDEISFRRYEPALKKPEKIKSVTEFNPFPDFDPEYYDNRPVPGMIAFCD